MPALFNRRNFLASTGAAFAASAICPNHAAAAPTPCPNEAETHTDSPLFEISLAQWSLHRKLRGGEMDNLDFAKVAKEEFDIQGIEYVSQFFGDKAQNHDYLGQMKQRAADLGVKSLLIMVDREGNLGHADQKQRLKSVENHYKWVEAAKFLGCHSIRVNAASEGTYQQQVALAADGLAKLSQFAAQENINVLVENHGGLSSNGQWLAQVIRKVGMENCGTLPDFGNFFINKGRDGSPVVEYDKYVGMAALMPFAKAVSAKSRYFDEAGNETETDYEKVLTIMLDAGYRGFVGIEYEGKTMGESDGIVATKNLLLRCREKLAKARG